MKNKPVTQRTDGGKLKPDLFLTRRSFLQHGFGAFVGASLGGNPGATLRPIFEFPFQSQEDQALDRRREYLATLLRVFPKTEPEPEGREGRISSTAASWEDWIQESGELPPDFSLMQSSPFLPDPLVDHAGGGDGQIETLDQWNRQKAWIREEFQKWILGRFPPPPDEMEVEITGVRPFGEAELHEVIVRFGPQMRGHLRLDVIVPPGKGPFPAFVTCHVDTSAWVRVPLRRGYVVCVFKAADPVRHEVDDSDAWIELYPEYDFSGMGRWAWAGMRAVDYLLTLPYINPEQIATGGNSRYAKSTLISAAYDDRIKAVLPSRGNCGCGIPWRFASGLFVNESLEEVTRLHRHWFHPRLRFFAGREDRLPVDQHMLVSLVAPRGLLLSHAYTEHQGNPWAIEQSYRAAKKVYQFLGAEENLGLLQRPGEHTVVASVVELYMDFCDGVFGRRPFLPPNDIVNGFTYQGWQEVQESNGLDIRTPPLQNRSWVTEAGSGLPWNVVRARIRRRIDWVLGEPPPEPQGRIDERVTYRASSTAQRSTTYPRTLFDRPARSESMGVASVNYGDELRADLYYSSRSEDGEPRWEEALPTVIWLHPYAYAMGYHRYEGQAFERLTRFGFNVIGVDLIGFGTRVEEIKGFYDRFPGHSLLGRMVLDLKALLTAIGGLEEVLQSHIYVVGSGLGAKAALFHAALDERVRGVAAVSGFSSLRRLQSDLTTEGIRHYSDLHGILPRLGRFVNPGTEVPVDYDEVLALIAPRPTLVIAPTLDRYHPVDSVEEIVGRGRAAFEIYGKGSALELETPEGFAGFETEWDREVRVIDWLREKAKR